VRQFKNDAFENEQFDYIERFTAAPDAPPNAFDAKAPYIDNGTTAFSPERYYSEEYAQKEWNLVWTKVWLLAGVASDLREPGDFLTFEVGRETFLIVKGADAQIRAFYNVCAHRGFKLVQSDSGSVAKAFTCPYHTWRYNLDGSLAAITDRETFRPEVVCHNPGLSAVRCEISNGLIFITMNGNPKPLSEQLGDFGARMGVYEIDKMVVVKHTRAEIASNWKIGMDGFIEPYHFHALHQQALPVIDDYHIQQDLYPNGVSRMIIKQLYPSHRLTQREAFNETLTATMRSAGLDPDTFEGTPMDVRKAAQLAKRTRAAELGRDYSNFTDSQITDSVTYSIFPNAGLGCHPEALILARFLPHATDPTKMYWDHMTLYRPVKQEDDSYAIPDFMAVDPGADVSGDTRPDITRFQIGDELKLGLLFQQDAEILPIQQAGVQSRGFRGSLFSEQELRVRHFHTELDRYMNGAK